MTSRYISLLCHMLCYACHLETSVVSLIMLLATVTQNTVIHCRYGSMTEKQIPSYQVSLKIRYITYIRMPLDGFQWTVFYGNFKIFCCIWLLIIFFFHRWFCTVNLHTGLILVFVFSFFGLFFVELLSLIVPQASNTTGDLLWQIRACHRHLVPQSTLHFVLFFLDQFFVF